MSKPKKSKTSPPARPHTTPRDWVLPAYIAALALTERPSSAYPLIGAWDDYEAAAARVLYMCAQGVAARPGDEVAHGALPRPAGFTTWAAAVKQLEQLAFPGPKSSGQRGPCAVSPYRVRMAKTEAEPLFDSRALYKPRQEFLDSIIQFGGTFERIKLLPLRGDDGSEALWVEDGRQRLNGVCEVNRTVIAEWYRNALSTARGHDLPPAVIATMPAEIRDEDLRAGLAIAAASNTQRRQDATLILAERAGMLRAPTVGADGEEIDGYHHAEIAVILGVSRQTVANLLLLQDLAPPMWVAVRAGSLPLSCAYLLAPLEHERQVELWAKVSASGREPGRQREHLRALIEGREISNRPAVKPRLVPELQRIRERLNGLDGNGPLVARAVLDWALGVRGLEAFREFPDDLQRQFVLTPQAPTVGGPAPAPTVGGPAPAPTRPRGKKGERLAAQWRLGNFDEQKQWEDAGVFNPWQADELRLAGITPKELKTPILMEGVFAPLGEHYACKRIGISGIRQWLRQIDLPMVADASSEGV